MVNLTEFVSELDKHPLIVRINFMDLYKTEVCDRLTQNVNRWYMFDSILLKDVIASKIVEHEKADSAEEKLRVTKQFYEEMRNSQTERSPSLYAAIIEFLKDIDQELYKMMYIDEWEHEASVLFLKFLVIMHKARPVMDIQKVIDYLSKYSSELRNNYEIVLTRWKNGEIDEDYAKSLICRTFPIMIEGSTYHLMYAIYLCSVDACLVIDNLFPNFEIFYLKNIFEDRGGIVHIVHEYDNVNDAIDEIMANENESPYSRNLYFDYIPNYQLSSLIYQTTKEPPINLRSYQLELIGNALQGNNTMICAPTGSGKTVVAAYIIRDHIINQRKRGKNPKIVFVVPTIPLVDQQESQMKKFLGKLVTTCGIHGGDADLDLHALFPIYDIFVLTAQVLVNFTDAKFCEINGNTPLMMDDFTLIVLDEVHHTTKAHPYNILMSEYHRRKYGNGNKVLRKMPQVIGLSASLGAPSDPKNIDEVLAYMVSVCANFDACYIEKVMKNVKDLEKFDTPDEIRYIPYDNSRIKIYYDHITRLSKAIESRLRSIPGIEVYGDIFKDHCEITKLQQYNNWVSNAIDRHLPKTHLPPNSMKQASDCLKYLKMLYEALQCSRCFPTTDTTNYYLKNFGCCDGTDLDKFAYAERQELSKQAKSECAIFKELVKLITTQFKELPESRIIIFVPLRMYAKMGTEVIERYTGHKAAYITGANAPTEFGGCNPSVQLETLQKFKDGEFRILFATSVADEGLDVADCNLVIKYNYATDNIAHVQRKGRARKLRSQSILITSDEKILEMEEKNKQLIKKVEDAYKIFYAMEPSSRYIMFDRAICDYNLKRVQEENEATFLREEMAPKCNDYNIICKSCSGFVIDCSKIRLLGTDKTCQNSIVVDPNFWSTVESKEGASEIEERMGLVGSTFCKSVVSGKCCGAMLGRIQSFQKFKLPTLRCKSLVFVKKANPLVKETKKQWKDVLKTLFYPEDVTPYELAVMKEAPLQPRFQTKRHTLRFNDLVIDGDAED